MTTNLDAPHQVALARIGASVRERLNGRASVNRIPVEAGGATAFTTLGIAIEPQPGALLLWNNPLADGRPNEATLHAGTPVERGVKYVITKWYRTRTWR